MADPRATITFQPGAYQGASLLVATAMSAFPRRAAPEAFLAHLDDHYAFPTLRSSLKNLGLVCHGASYAAGWWHDPKTGEPINPSMGEKLMLIVSEVSEAMEAHRKGLMDDKLPSRNGVEVELADAVIRIFDLAAAANLDLPGALIEKLGYNASRPDHKPEARAAGGKAY